MLARTPRAMTTAMAFVPFPLFVYVFEFKAHEANAERRFDGRATIRQQCRSVDEESIKELRLKPW
jgi:hypothetical protein